MPTKPDVVVFDVNETLSDLSPMAGRFADVGAAGGLAATWLATILRDGIGLAAAGGFAGFATIAAEQARTLLSGQPLDREVEAAVQHIMEGLGQLGLHPDVVGGVRGLRAAGLRLATLSNGSREIAERLLGAEGLLEDFEALLSVEDAGAWKPAPRSYAYAARSLGVQPSAMMLVAVHPWDLDGAARAGLATCWLDRDGGHYPAYLSAPDLTVRELTQLPAELSSATAG